MFWVHVADHWRGRSPTGTEVALPIASQEKPHATKNMIAAGWFDLIWGIILRGKDLNLRPPGYEPGELPDCSTPPRQCICRSVGGSTSNALECARACGSDALGIEASIA